MLLSRNYFNQANIRLEKSAALKSVISLPKARLQRMLSRYMISEDTYYYDVVHLLDLGISLPRDRAVAAARRSLERQLNYSL